MLLLLSCIWHKDNHRIWGGEDPIIKEEHKAEVPSLAIDFGQNPMEEDTELELMLEEMESYAPAQEIESKAEDDSASNSQLGSMSQMSQGEEQEKKVF